MNSYSEPMDFLEECYCESCKNVFAVPTIDGMEELCHPSYCCFCGLEFGYIIEGIDEKRY